MDKIRVLRVITWLPQGGIERKIVEVLPRLDRDRFDVSLVCLREEGPLADVLRERGIRVDCIPFRRRWDVGALGRLTDLMRERRIDIVHSHMYRSNVPATVAARRAGVPRVWAQIHNVGTWETRRQLWMDRFMCRWREGLIAVSEQVRREAIGKLRLAEDRVRVIYNGVDTDRFGTGEGREEVRAACGAGADDLVFVLPARLVAQKRPEDFLALADELMKREGSDPARPKSRFWIVGKGDLEESLRERAGELGLADRVSFLGFRDDIERVLAAADVFVMTSSKEGFSNSLAEAMASGLAIIATDVGGNAEAIRDGLEGHIIPAGDAARLLEAGEKVLLDGGHRASVAESARAGSGFWARQNVAGC